MGLRKYFCSWLVVNLFIIYNSSVDGSGGEEVRGGVGLGKTSQDFTQPHFVKVVQTCTACSGP